MLSLICAFFIISPLLILYTAGYRYSFAGGNFLATGVISIDAEPDDTTVSIDGIRLAQSLPVRKTNLVPEKNYHIRLERDGYHSWEKDIYVRSNQTAYVKDVELFRNESPTLVDIGYEPTSVSVSPFGQYALSEIYNAQSGRTDVVLIDAYAQATTTIHSLSQSDAIVMSWSPFAQYAFIAHTSATSTDLVLIDPAQNVSTRHTLAPDAAFQWLNNPRSPTVAVKTNTQVYRVADDLQLIGGTTSTVWFVDKHANVWSYDPLTKDVSQDGSKQRFTLARPPVRIIDVTDAHVLVQTSDGADMYDRRSGMRVLDVPTHHVLYSNAVGHWTTWSPWEMWDLRDGEASLINRTGERIQSVTTLDDNGALGIISHDAVTAFLPSYFTSQQLYTAETITGAGADTQRRLILVHHTSGMSLIQY
jgi:hypothetical protein